MITAALIRRERKLIAAEYEDYRLNCNHSSRSGRAIRIDAEQQAWLAANAATYTAKEAARRLGCASNTVRTHAVRLGVTLKPGVPYTYER